MTDFTEVADRVWVARYPWLDVNVTLVGGRAGLVMVDSNASARAARAMLDDVRRLGAGRLSALVNTHEHWDHTFGNLVLLDEYAGLAVHATDWAAAHTVTAGERVKQLYRDDPDDPHAEEVLETAIVPADHTFATTQLLDLGDREIQLRHPGRGHTAGDLVVHVPDADVLIAGDLVEESGPPAYGDDSWPLEWPATLDLVLGLLTDESVVVPGHGAVVDRDFVVRQRADVGVVADTVRRLAGQGVSLEEALVTAQWPFPPDRLTAAVRRGYSQLAL